MTTTANASTSPRPPIPGTTDTAGAVSAAPMAASIVQRERDQEDAVHVDLPSAAAISRSWITAVRSLPKAGAVQAPRVARGGHPAGDEQRASRRDTRAAHETVRQQSIGSDTK